MHISILIIIINVSGSAKLLPAELIINQLKAENFFITINYSGRIV